MNPTTPNLLQIKRFVAAPRARVFAAFTDAGDLATWMGPEENMCREARADVRAGGTYSFRMRGCPSSGRETMVVHGEYLEVRPPERLVFTWAWEGVPDAPSQVTVEFFELDGGTDVHLTHEQLAGAGSRDRHTHGWTGSLAKLGRLCAPESEEPRRSGEEKGTRPGVGMFGWNELMTPAVGPAQTFYTQLFGWTAAAFPGNSDYTLFSAGSTMAGGMMACPQPETPAHWLGYVIVADCDAAASRVTKLGGKICLPPKDIPTVGRIAIFTDPQGAPLGLFQPVPK